MVTYVIKPSHVEPGKNQTELKTQINMTSFGTPTNDVLDPHGKNTENVDEVHDRLPKLDAIRGDDEAYQKLYGEETGAEGVNVLQDRMWLRLHETPDFPVVAVRRVNVRGQQRGLGNAG